MSMLAEGRRKQKWYILQANVNKETNWSKDNNKFGQKMLERMGWKEGKGLGRKEDGLTDYVKVRYKSNSKGVGFKDSVEWSEQQDNFKTLLEQLGNSNENGNDKLQEIKSLEEKSQNSRARVHYRKFTRGKDLSRYSHKDLANIFGKKSLTSEDVPESVVEEVLQEEESSATNLHGVTTVEGGCMLTYFKNKKFANNVTKCNDSKNSSDSEGNSTSYGFGFANNLASIFLKQGNNDVNTCSDELSEISTKNKTFKKVTEYARNFVSYVTSDVSDDNGSLKKKKNKDYINELKETPSKRKGESLDVIEEVETPSKKKLKFEASREKESKKSKKKLKSEFNTDLGLSNPAFEPLNNKIVIKKHVLNTITENDVENDSNDSQTIQDNFKVKVDDSLGENKPKQKKKKKQKIDVGSFAIDNPIFNINTCSELSQNSLGTLNETQSGQEANENSILEHNFKLKRKKKKKAKDFEETEAKSNNECGDSCMDLAESPQQDMETSIQETKRKSKKKSKGLDNPALNFNDSFSNAAQSQQGDESSTHEIKRKDKKKSKGLDNPALNFNDSFSNAAQSPQGDESSTHEVKRKDKKKSKGLDNPALNLNESNSLVVEQDCGSSSNYESKQKKKKKSKGIHNAALNLRDSVLKSSGLDNPALNLNDSLLSTAESQSVEALTDHKVKRKKKKSKNCIKVPNQSTTADLQESLQNGIENSAMDITDCAITHGSVKVPVEAITPKLHKRRSKKVQFSNTNEEFIISDRSPGDIEKRNELYDINTKVIEDGLRDMKKQKNSNSIQEFDITSVDKIDFCDDGLSKIQPRGIDNCAFDAKAQKIEESVSSITKSIDQYQAEVENDINESKHIRNVQTGPKLGEFGIPECENERHKDGVLLRFKYARFNNKEPPWAKRENTVANSAKKSYKHLIRGDIVLCFKNSNLHQVNGYAYGKKKNEDLC